MQNLNNDITKINTQIGSTDGAVRWLDGICRTLPHCGDIDSCTINTYIELIATILAKHKEKLQNKINKIQEVVNNNE